MYRGAACAAPLIAQVERRPAARRFASSALNCSTTSSTLVASATAAAARVSLGPVGPEGPVGPVGPLIYAQPENAATMWLSAIQNNLTSSMITPKTP